MEREVVRHSVASLVALVVTYGTLAVVVLTIPGPDVVARTSSATGALVFGVYGPAFLLLTALTFSRSAGGRLRSLLVGTEERRNWVRRLLLVGPKSWAVIVMTAGLTAVVALAVGDARGDPLLVTLCLIGVVGSWVTMVAVFAVEYMRLWAKEDAIVFPGDEDRSFRDFVYLAVQFSTTFSSSDVQLVRRSARSLATVHSVVAFAYSTAIIAVVASLLISG